MKKQLLLLVMFATSLLHAQVYFPTNKGVKTTKNTTVAFTNAKIYVTPTNIIKKGTLLVKDGKVVQVSNSVKIPRHAKIIDLSGKVVYPSFVDIYTDFGVKNLKGLEVITENLNMMQVEWLLLERSYPTRNRC